MKYRTILHPSASEIAEIKDEFKAFLKGRFRNLPDESQDLLFSISLKDDSNKLLAGLVGNIYWDGLEIDTLWVDEYQRNKGIGTNLVFEAENLAIKNGAVVAFLKTVEAKGFYQKSGYEVYGVLEDRPIGSVLYHMKKRLKQTR